MLWICVLGKSSKRANDRTIKHDEVPKFSFIISHAESSPFSWFMFCFTSCLCVFPPCVTYVPVVN